MYLPISKTVEVEVQWIVNRQHDIGKSIDNVRHCWVVEKEVKHEVDASVGGGEDGEGKHDGNQKSCHLHLILSSFYLPVSVFEISLRKNYLKERKLKHLDKNKETWLLSLHHNFHTLEIYPC